MSQSATLSETQTVLSRVEVTVDARPGCIEFIVVPPAPLIVILSFKPFILFTTLPFTISIDVPDIILYPDELNSILGTNSSSLPTFIPNQ